MLRLTLRFDLKKSPAHSLLLTKFLYPQEVGRFIESRDWERVLGEHPRKAIQRFIDEGLLEPVELPELLARCYKVVDLQEMLKQRGLSTSGRKDDLINRLIEADPEGMRRAVAGVTLLKCSQQGRQLAEEYLAQEQVKRERAERDVIEALAKHRFKEAALIMASYEAGQVFPRGMGIDWRHYDPSRDIELLVAIFQLRPRCLSHLSDAQLEKVRIAAGMCVLMWNVGQATEWLESNETQELGLPYEVAMLTVKSYAQFRVELNHLRQLGYKWVGVITCNDNNVCESCRKLSARRYAIDKVPELPYEGCTSEICRCSIVGYWQ